jgi:hypothetical protein
MIALLQVAKLLQVGETYVLLPLVIHP